MEIPQSMQTLVLLGLSENLQESYAYMWPTDLEENQKRFWPSCQDHLERQARSSYNKSHLCTLHRLWYTSQAVTSTTTNPVATRIPRCHLAVATNNLEQMVRCRWPIGSDWNHFAVLNHPSPRSGLQILQIKCLPL